MILAFLNADARVCNDFCNLHADTGIKIVLSAIAIITAWLNDHRKCGAAACRMLKVTQESNYWEKCNGELF